MSSKLHDDYCPKCDRVTKHTWIRTDGGNWQWVCQDCKAVNDTELDDDDYRLQPLAAKGAPDA